MCLRSGDAGRLACFSRGRSFLRPLLSARRPDQRVQRKNAERNCCLCLKLSASRGPCLGPGLIGPFVTHVSRRLRKEDHSTLTTRCTRTQTRIGEPSFEAFSLGSPSQVMSGPVNGSVRLEVSKMGFKHISLSEKNALCVYAPAMQAAWRASLKQGFFRPLLSARRPDQRVQRKGAERNYCLCLKLRLLALPAASSRATSALS